MGQRTTNNSIDPRQIGRVMAAYALTEQYLDDRHTEAGSEKLNGIRVPFFFSLKHKDVIGGKELFQSRHLTASQKISAFVKASKCFQVEMSGPILICGRKWSFCQHKLDERHKIKR